MYTPYPERRRIYVRTYAVLLNLHLITRVEFARRLRAIMGAHRED